jgi:hypothetical protein
MLSKSYLFKKKFNSWSISRLPLISPVVQIRFQKFQSSKHLNDSATSPINQQPKKSYIPTEQRDLQRITTQSLIHEISMQQMEAANKVVPWFLEQMPVSYSRILVIVIVIEVDVEVICSCFYYRPVIFVKFLQRPENNTSKQSPPSVNSINRIYP